MPTGSTKSPGLSTPQRNNPVSSPFGTQALLVRLFNSGSVDFKARWWAGSKPRDGHENRDKVVRAIKRRLDDAGIEIPFPYIAHAFKNAFQWGKNRVNSAAVRTVLAGISRQ